MSKLMVIEVKGNHHKWAFEFYGDTKYIEDWRKDGLTVDVMSNTFPRWLPYQLVPTYAWLQDVFHFNWSRK